MNMEQTILSIFAKPIYLGGPSANPDWNIPLQLKSLCGEIDAAQMLVQLHEPLLDQRLTGHGEALNELERVFIQEFQNVLTHWFSRLTTEPDFCRGLCVRARAGVP